MTPVLGRQRQENVNSHQLGLQNNFQDSLDHAEKSYLEKLFFFFSGGVFKSAYLLSVFGASGVKHL